MSCLAMCCIYTTLLQICHSVIRWRLQCRAWCFVCCVLIQIQIKQYPKTKSNKFKPYSIHCTIRLCGSGVNFFYIFLQKKRIRCGDMDQGSCPSITPRDSITPPSFRGLSELGGGGLSKRASLGTLLYIRIIHRKDSAAPAAIHMPQLRALSRSGPPMYKRI